MCGLAGIVGRCDGAALSAMMAPLAHRGPDDDAAWFDEDAGVSLGFRRLAVIDPGGGRQPMADSSGSLVLVFNGEIYNHAALRRDLESAGHVFSSDHSDSETILEGYRRWGGDVVEHLDGMFAFAIFDVARQRLPKW